MRSRISPESVLPQLVRAHGINDNLLFTWRQRYSHLLPDEIQRSIDKPAPVLPVVVSDMSLSSRSEPRYEPAISEIWLQLKQELTRDSRPLCELAGSITGLISQVSFCLSRIEGSGDKNRILH
ncbi:hypothetical protein AAA67_002930 [Salmonella enterica subsp. diarizonae]|nr:hypothetical protein [Salmonella enterica subsp. diarizonae]